MVSWENSPKKEGAYPKREIDTERLQKNTHRLQQTTKVRHSLKFTSLTTKDYKSWIWITNSTHIL